MGQAKPSYEDLEKRINDLQDKLVETTVYKSAMDRTNTLLAIMKMDTTIEYVNHAHHAVLGYDENELIGMKGFDLIHPDDRKRLFSLLAKYTKKFVGVTLNNFLTGKHDLLSEIVEYRVRDNSGNWHWLESVGTIIENRLYDISRDITDKKLAEESVRESEGKYRSLVDNASVLIARIDTEGRFVLVNRKFLGLSGLSEKDVIGHTGEVLAPFFPPEEFIKMVETVKKSLSERISTEIELWPIVPHGNQGCIKQITYPFYNTKKEFCGIEIISYDISEEKTYQKIITEKNRFAGLRADIWKMASDKSLTEEKMIQNLLDKLGPFLGVCRACYNKSTADSIDSGETRCIIEWCGPEIKSSLGSSLPSHIIKHLIKKDHFILDRDSVLKMLPKSLRATAKPIINAFIKALNLESILVFPYSVNNRVEGMITFDICKGSKTRPEWTDDIINLLFEVVIIISNHIAYKRTSYELEKYRHNLEDLVAQRTSELTETNDQLQREIQERVKTEKALRRAEKMETVGILAGGVAHDLNNILAGIVTCPDLLLMDIPKDHPNRELITAIKDSGLKAASIVQDLLSLAQNGYKSTEITNLNTIIEDYIKSLEFIRLKDSRPDITFTVNCKKDLPHLIGCPTHISKMIMNLTLNATEAIPVGKGSISISTSLIKSGKDTNCYDNIPAGKYSVLTISDTGKGISPDDLGRIFEPFYTKRIMGRPGTGLGLSVVWNTVKEHGGYIDVRSVEGKGTSFDLYFPAVEHSLHLKERSDHIEDYTGNGEKILVVDDVKEQRDAALRILKKISYKAHAVASGEEAYEHVKKHPVDLLILDMILGSAMDGLDTYRKILELYPGQKAIITSGFSETERVLEAQRCGAGQYIRKPYTIEMLGSAIKKELSR